MATYFQGSDLEIQAAPSPDGFHKLYLLNPASASAATYVPYSDAGASHTPNFLLLNRNSHNLASLPHAPPPSSSNHGLVALGSDDPTRPAFLGHENSGFHGFTAAAEPPPPRVHYNFWGSMIDHQAPSAAASTSSGGAASADPVSPHMGFRRPSQQGLSLSLSSQQQQTAFNRSLSGEFDPPVQPRAGSDVRILGNHIPSSTTSFSNGVSNMQSFVLGSKYLRAAQEVLDEVVNVGKGIHKDDSTERNYDKDKAKLNRESTSGGIAEGGGGELSTAQRQELQMKKSKLVSMLDEVEQRYRQYQHQMQIVISSFGEAAGYGAARTYTALALKTISKQFRSLKDAIAWQVRATRKSLGEEDCMGGKVEGSRLRYVDHHLRQQRALQHLGMNMMQHNAWRPQRGLPERAVSILRAWLFEHFLHPYPKDSDKVMLAKQTGLTRGQVSNWFINARVRLWKPMVEEMYTEEMKEQEGISGSQENNNNTNNNNNDRNSSRTTKEAGKEVVGSSPTKDSSSQLQDHHHHLQINSFQSNNNNNNPPDQSFTNHKHPHLTSQFLQCTSWTWN